MGTWLDLSRTVKATGRIDAGLVDEIAADRAERELAELHKLGLPCTFESVYVHQRILTEQVAKTALDAVETARLLAAASPAERAAHTLDLRAELAETSIPPNPAKAAVLREMAAVCRAASWRNNVVDLRHLPAAE
jgi:hypothetical protein